ncbi:MAG: Ca2+-dependent phosphoinositide-specific phospholipase C [Luteolibacter sp.]
MKRFGNCIVAIFLGGMSMALAEEVRMNQIQVIGSHNSYHLPPEKELMGVISMFSKRALEAWSYSHEPLNLQLESGVRQFELDVYADPEGGLYSQADHPALEEMKQPGFKVFHVPNLDFQSNHPTFKGALIAVRDWSQKYPKHVPVMILVETKDSKEVPFAPEPVKYDREMLEELEAEILSVFDREQLITPDLVRGDSETLRDAVLKNGWPLLDEVRGKVMFCLDNEGSHRNMYLEGDPTLKNRLMFVSVDRSHPAAAFIKRNNALRSSDEIRELVAEGFIVRTRADGESVEARANDMSRAQKALASGAQFVSTDYPKPDGKIGPYYVALPEKVTARANPVSLPKGPVGEIE